MADFNQAVFGASMEAVGFIHRVPQSKIHLPQQLKFTEPTESMTNVFFLIADHTDVMMFNNGAQAGRIAAYRDVYVVVSNVVAADGTGPVSNYLLKIYLNLAAYVENSKTTYGWDAVECQIDIKGNVQEMTMEANPVRKHHRRDSKLKVKIGKRQEPKNEAELAKNFSALKDDLFHPSYIGIKPGGVEYSTWLWGDRWDERFFTYDAREIKGSMASDLAGVYSDTDVDIQSDGLDVEPTGSFIIKSPWTLTGSAPAPTA